MSTSALLRKWDNSSRTGRVRILEDLVSRCSAMTAPQLEYELGNGASLMLARISSWLRLTYALGQPVALQLRALGVFISAPSGQRFLAEYVEVGGIATLVEILTLTTLADPDATEAIKLLLAVADAGRPYKEVICESEGVASLEKFMSIDRSEHLLEPCSQLLVNLSRGNPAYSESAQRALLRLLGSAVTTSQRLACTGLRTLLSAALEAQRQDPSSAEMAGMVPVLDEAYADAAVSLLASKNLQVLYEAHQLFSVLINYAPIEPSLVLKLVELISDAPTASLFPVQSNVQAAAARSVGQLVSGLSAEKRAQHCDKLHIISWLCAMLLRTDASECQKSAAQALQLLGWCSGSPLDEIRSLLGSRGASLLTSLLDSADAANILGMLTPKVTDGLRSNLQPFLDEQQRQRARDEPVSGLLTQQTSFEQPTGDHGTTAQPTAA